MAETEMIWRLKTHPATKDVLHDLNLLVRRWHRAKRLMEKQERREMQGPIAIAARRPQVRARRQNDNQKPTSSGTVQ